MKNVGIAELKARLSEHLREVRQGHGLVVMHRDTPVARVVPYASDADRLEVREPLGKYASLQQVPLPRPLRLEMDAVDVLLDQRQGER